MVKATNPHFFNIILSDTLSQGKLLIPRMFVKRFGVYLSDKVFLRVPSGSKWQVELVKNGDCIYFGNGWQQFVDYYSISHGFFLVSGFESFETCCLDVLIFDKSATEIDYPVNDKHLQENAIPHIIGSHNISNRPCKKQFQVSRCNPDRSAKRKHFLTNTKTPKSVTRATTSYNSGNPSFSITMHPSHISKTYQVTIPVAAATQYFGEHRGRITLSPVDGRTRSVDYASYRKNRGHKETIISRGWREFVRDNRLKVGDVCVFELINGNTEKVKVVISRKGGDAKTNCSI